jgi:hypothetical protein
MAVATGTISSSFSDYRVWNVAITGCVFNAASTYTPGFRSRALSAGSFVVSGTWGTSTDVTVQLQGSQDNTNWIAIGSALVSGASGQTAPLGGAISPDGLVFSFYRFTLTGGDSGTALAIAVRLSDLAT